MGTTIRRSIGDTVPLYYIIKDIPFGSERSSAVDLEDKVVKFTMIDDIVRDYDVPDDYRFDTEVERDSYFVTNPDERLRGLLVMVDEDYQRWTGSVWSDDYQVVVNEGACTLVTGTTGGVGYEFTAAEVAYAGMYHIYFTMYDTEEVEEETVLTTSKKYPYNNSLWIFIVDVLTE